MDNEQLTADDMKGSGAIRKLAASIIGFERGSVQPEGSTMCTMYRYEQNEAGQWIAVEVGKKIRTAGPKMFGGVVCEGGTENWIGLSTDTDTPGTGEI